MAGFLGLAGGMGGWFVADESIDLVRSVVRFEDRFVPRAGLRDLGMDPVELLFDAMAESFGFDEAHRFFRSEG